MTKPPYERGSMADVEPTHGLKVASLFSGCGGSSLGYRQAGYQVLYASEFIEAARDTYRANASPSTIVDPRDVRTVTGPDLLAQLGLDVGELDLLDGSPPCASFSMAGNRESGWGKVSSYSDTKQRTDDLFDEYVRLLRSVRPRAFIAENVTGLVRGTSKGYFKTIYRALRESGYTIEARVVNASRLGVPQARQRLIIMGARDDLGRAPVFPTPTPWVYTVRDALGSVHEHPPRVDVDPETGWDLTFLTRYTHGADYYRLKAGRSKRYLQSCIADPNRPCPTITSNVRAAGVMHHLELRPFSLAELRAVCGFPSDFILTGTYVQRWERLGRAVPPPMMRALSSSLAETVLLPSSAAA